MLRCNMNYVIPALNYILKNSKGIISVLEIERRSRNNSIKRKYINNICLQILYLLDFPIELVI